MAMGFGLITKMKLKQPIPVSYCRPGLVRIHPTVAPSFLYPRPLMS